MSGAGQLDMQGSRQAGSGTAGGSITCTKRQVQEGRGHAGRKEPRPWRWAQRLIQEGDEEDPRNGLMEPWQEVMLGQGSA